MFAVWILTWLVRPVVHLYFSCSKGCPRGQSADHYTDTTLVKRKKNLNSNHSSQAESSGLYLQLHCFMKLNSSCCSLPAVILIFVGSPAFSAWFLWCSHVSWLHFLLNWPWNVHKLEHSSPLSHPEQKLIFCPRAVQINCLWKYFVPCGGASRSGNLKVIGLILSPCQLHVKPLPSLARC